MAWHDSWTQMKKKPTPKETTSMDWPIDDDEPETQTQTTQYERLEVPEGTHELQIHQVLPSDEQLELRLVHDDPQYGWVFLRLKRGQKWAKALVKQLAKALGMTAQDWADTDKGDLVGRRVRAVIEHKVKGDRMYVNVVGFEPQAATAPQEPAKPSPVARTPAAKVRAASPDIGNDDIPF
jgi:preprotein translocase subunit SecD